MCDKDEINEPVLCDQWITLTDMCGKVENLFTIQTCSSRECDMFVCGACDKALPGNDGSKPFKYCSYRHFQDMLASLE